MLAGKAGAARQKRPVDFSTFLKHADAPEPQRQPTSFSSFLRHAMLDSPDDINPSLLPSHYAFVAPAVFSSHLPCYSDPCLPQLP